VLGRRRLRSSCERLAGRRVTAAGGSAFHRVMSTAGHPQAPSLRMKFASLGRGAVLSCCCLAVIVCTPLVIL